jgi:2-polyprenyl-3-methyl-5-hydroxy-6-metoxy-1,4-benzoquinol methylase
MGDPDCLAIYDDVDLYEREFGDRTFDVDFWVRKALRAGGPVLEVACGTGRLTLPIARAGIAITGLDVSAPMLERARDKSRREGLAIEWVHADCRDFALPGQFRLIFIAAGALQHLHDTASVLAFFRCVQAHLAPGGEFVLDVFNPSVAKLARGPEVSYLFREFDGLSVTASSSYDAATQVQRFELTYTDATGRLVHTKRVGMRCFFPQELDLLCAHGGWDVVEKFGDHDENPFTAGSPRQIVVCRPLSER